MTVFQQLVGPEGVGVWVAALLTLMVYSYLLGDNPLFRLAEHLLVAVSVGYAMIVAYHTVLVPRLFAPLAENASEHPDLILPLVLGIFLLFKTLPGAARLGNPGLGYLLGIGLGLAVGGAIAGTLLPQVQATFLPILPGEGVSLAGAIANIVIAVGTIATLLSFRAVEGVGRERARSTPGEAAPDLWGWVGRSFIMVAFGAFFGGAAVTYFSLLVGRWDFLINDWLRPMLGF